MAGRLALVICILSVIHCHEYAELAAVYLETVTFGSIYSEPELIVIIVYRLVANQLKIVIVRRFKGL